MKSDIRLHEAIVEKNPKNCSLVFCTPAASCVDVHNNISESFNNAIDPARYVPLVEMLETIRRSAMIRIEMRKQKAKNHKGRFTLRAKEFIELEQKKLKFCKFFPGSDGRKPKPKRKKGRHESPAKKRVSRERRIMHCGHCGIAGHNASKCKNSGAEKFKKPRKKTSFIEEDGIESMTQD
ncbi:hypothetical protein F2Q70_00006711 [Brassica cretica]|uniref:CCHC-type domain-containing protein n=1 Tax=Brassica cretica TaxID=69181 RepID=A0A8S9IXX3_BRACR|nr:hypothetical protein F2Q68_00023383 [Brassica cretica]KAF2574920.1 hypothetical protein F2Q70_00006711 [Brassica cretica]